MEVIWTCPIISRTPSDPIFPNVPSLTPTHLWFSAGAAVYFFSIDWVSLSSKEMPLTCSAGCSRQSAGCGWVHDPQAFLYLRIRWRSAPLGTSANSLVAGDFLEYL